MKKEKWKRIYIKKTATDYFISNYGEVKSIKKNKEIILRKSVHTDGYFQVKLYINGKPKTIKNHVLVASAFVKGRKHKYMVDHIDCDKQNNYYKNLEWVTNAENIRRAYANNLISLMIGERNHACKITENIAIQICESLESLVSIRDIASELQIPETIVREIKIGRSWKHISSHYNINHTEVRGKYFYLYDKIDKELKKDINMHYKEICKKLNIDADLSMKDLVKNRKKKVKGSTTIESDCYIDLCDVHTLQEVKLCINY